MSLSLFEPKVPSRINPPSGTPVAPSAKVRKVLTILRQLNAICSFGLLLLVSEMALLEIPPLLVLSLVPKLVLVDSSGLLLLLTEIIVLVLLSLRLE